MAETAFGHLLLNCYTFPMIGVDKAILGERMVRAAVREFWLEQQLSCPCCPVFLEDQNQRCWRIFYDDEELSWGLDTGKMPFPEVGSIVGNEEMEWRDVNLAGANRILGIATVGLDQSNTEDEAQFVISFDNGVCLSLRHRFSDDSSSFVILSTV